MLPNANDLRNFIEVARAKNITRASRSLGISQPSLSQSIRKLESTLKVELLSRQKNGVELSRAGKRVLARAEELLDIWESVGREALEEEDELQGRFVLGCHPSVAQYALPPFLPAILENYPRLRFDLVHDLSRNVVSQVIEREIDIGIAVNPVRHPDLVIQPLVKDSFALWHLPKARRSEALFCDPKLGQVQWLSKKLEKEGFRPAQVIPCENLDVIASLARAGAGYALLPERVARPTEGVRLTEVDRRFPRYADEVFLVYRADSMRTRAAKLLVAEIRKAFK